VFNSYNFLLWGDENPHTVRQGAFQYRWSINIWTGIKTNRNKYKLGNSLSLFLSLAIFLKTHSSNFQIGPYFLPPRLTGNVYIRSWKMSCLCFSKTFHFVNAKSSFSSTTGFLRTFRVKRDILNARYPGKWMGRDGPIYWPTRSPDLNVLDYFIWSHVKDLIEHKRDGNEDKTREAIFAAFNAITPEMAHCATRNIAWRADFCLQERGLRAIPALNNESGLDLLGIPL